MQKMWEFFEALDEMVYASDLETHELIYMNRHLRTALGYDKPEEYVGKSAMRCFRAAMPPAPSAPTSALRQENLPRGPTRIPCLGSGIW